MTIFERIIWAIMVILMVVVFVFNKEEKAPAIPIQETKQDFVGVRVDFDNGFFVSANVAKDSLIVGRTDANTWLSLEYDTGGLSSYIDWANGWKLHVSKDNLSREFLKEVNGKAVKITHFDYAEGKYNKLFDDLIIKTQYPYP